MAGDTDAISVKDFQAFQKELLEEQKKTWAKYQEVNDIILKQEQTRAQAETKLLKEQGTLNERLDQFEVLLQGKAAGTAMDPRSELAKEFSTYMRKGIAGPNMQKALSEGNATLGGYLAPPEYVKEILKGIIEYSPIRQISKVITTSASSVQIPKRTGQFTATWLGAEAGTVIPEATGLTYGLEELPTHPLVAKVLVSMKLLNDSAFNLDSELNGEFAERFAVAEGTAFVSGTGKNQPEGILTNASVASVISGAAATIPSADCLYSLQAELKDGYARNAKWLMKRATKYAIRKLKDGNGKYIWEPALTAGQPADLLGSPVVECVDMPAIGAGTYPIAYGDYARGYEIVDSTMAFFTRDDISLRDYLQVKYIGARFLGAQVVNAEAIKKLVISA